MELRCPDCSAPLQAGLYEGVAVHACAACQGTLVGKRELQQIVRRREQPIPRDLPKPRPRTETTRTCPRCQAPMKKGKYGKLRVTTFDMCEPCAILWLDAGELESILLDHQIVTENKARSAGLSAATAAAAAQAGGAAEAAPKSFACPKCGHAQPKGTECVRCGIIFEKYERAQRERAARDAADAALTESVETALREVSGYEVLQRYHLSEAIVGVERANQYTMTPLGGTSRAAVWQIEETNRSGLSILGRNLLGTLYAFSMSMLDESRRCVMMFERRARFYFYHLDVFDETGHMVGHVRRRFSFFNRVVTAHDADGRDVFRIVGPFYRPWTFRVSQGNAEAGTITKRWTGWLKEAYTDADHFTVRFGRTLDTRARRLLLGATMLIDSLYFEGRKHFLSHFFSAPGVQMILVGLFLTWAVHDIPRQLGPGYLGNPLPPVVEARSGAAVRQRELLDLVNKREPLSSLAREGRYTVVEVYLDTCSICRRLEKGFPAFTKKRQDVVIERVHAPEGGLSLSFKGNTREEMEKDMLALRSILQPICGTPHVEIYDPNLQPLAKDVCGKKDGTRYLRSWISAEAKVPVSELQGAQGADAFTPIRGAR